MNQSSSTTAAPAPPTVTSSATAPTSCGDRVRDGVDKAIVFFFARILGAWVGTRPKLVLTMTIVVCLAVGLTGIFQALETESRVEKLWLPQNTRANREELVYERYFGNSGIRLNQIIAQVADDEDDTNVLQKKHLVAAMQLHKEIETGTVPMESSDDSTNNTLVSFTDLCVAIRFGNCASKSETGVCGCVMNSLLGLWNYDIETLQADEEWLETLQQSDDSLSEVLGKPEYDSEGTLVAAKALVLNYILQDRSYVENGAKLDPLNSAWEQDIFLKIAGDTSSLHLEYFSERSFDDALNGSINGDLVLVQVSFMVVFLFLGATLGKVKCGTGSRWTLAQAGVLLVVLSAIASIGLASLAGLFYGPVHSLLPFVLLGIGVDDAFVLVNAFNRERKVPRPQESNADIAARSTRALARAGASITVTSATDLVAFLISSGSGLPALASFCAYAALGVFFLWFLSSTLFAAALVLDERRQRDNRHEICCWNTRKGEYQEDGDSFEEGFVSKIFRRYHAPTILSKTGKLLVFLVFTSLLAFGVYGANQLGVEDSTRKFIPSDHYIQGWFEKGDEYFTSRGNPVDFIFEGGVEIYQARGELATLSERVSGLSEESPYFAEPSSEDVFRNVMGGFKRFLGTGSFASSFLNVTLGDDGWPVTEKDFVSSMAIYTSGFGATFARDVSFNENGSSLNAIRVKAEYVRLVKAYRGGRLIGDAWKLVDSMETTREIADAWEDLPPVTVHGGLSFVSAEGFKIIRLELFQNVGLAVLAVSIIVFLTIGSLIVSILITLNVAFCIIEILGFMYAIGIVIDSVSVIYMVLAIGLSVDYSAHIGHCFMTKGGNDKNHRATEALADIGSAVLSGATTTFLAVFVLFFSKSYIFSTLATMFGLSVGLGALHGLVALPVMLSVLGPPPFASAEFSKVGECSDDDASRNETASEVAYPVESELRIAHTDDDVEVFTDSPRSERGVGGVNSNFETRA